MSKIKTKYVCSNCGFESPKWLGKCPSCGSWDTFTEEIEESAKPNIYKVKRETEAQPIMNIGSNDEPRIETVINEFDRVLGGGLVRGSVVLIGGDPGIGKSTLVLQAFSGIKEKVLYVTGEESVKQLGLRAKRLKIKAENIVALAETNLNRILQTVEKENPDVVIVDSIQTVYRDDLDNAPGTVTQIRESASVLMNYAKASGVAIVVVGHVTKEGIIAGPKVLEHIVDTVLQFEGERNHSYRILRAQKNRYGNTNEIGIFEMRDDGLREVENPSEVFLNNRGNSLSGSVVTATIEGSRPVLLEVQALVTPSHFGNPQRVATGFDYRRLSILLAVLEKRANIRASSHNVFLNMAGGLKVDEPAVDLAVCLSIASSLANASIKSNLIAIGEVGLGGEVRAISHIEKRIREAEKLGFEFALIPTANKKSVPKNKLAISFVNSLEEAISKAF